MSRSKAKIEGNCHICGTYGELTAEHVPPQKAFNNRRTIKLPFDHAINLGPEEIPRGRYEQGGVKMYTLCGSCNNNTGNWYANDFVDWCYQGADILTKSNYRPSLIYMYHAFPLRIIKQIITMFCSVAGVGFTQKHPYIVDFLLNKNTRYLPDLINVFVYYNFEGRLRYSGISGQLRPHGKIIVMSEITFPPFGYVMTLNSDPPDQRLFSISHFAQYGYNDYDYIKLYPPILPTHVYLPGDYRSKNKILQAVEQNRLYDERG